MVNGLYIAPLSKALYNLCLSSPFHTHIHTPTCHASYQSAHLEQLGVRCLAQGHFDTSRVGLNRQQLLPPEPSRPTYMATAKATKLDCTTPWLHDGDKGLHVARLNVVEHKICKTSITATEMSLSEVQGKPIISHLNRGQEIELHPNIQVVSSDWSHHAEGSWDLVTRMLQTGHPYLVSGYSPNQAPNLAEIFQASKWKLLIPLKNIFSPILCRVVTEAASPGISKS